MNCSTGLKWTRIQVKLHFTGLLGDSLSCSIDDPYGAGRWRSEVDLKGGNNGITSPRASSTSGAAATSNGNEENGRKISPPLAAVLASSRIRYMHLFNINPWLLCICVRCLEQFETL